MDYQVIVFEISTKIAGTFYGWEQMPDYPGLMERILLSTHLRMVCLGIKSGPLLSRKKGIYGLELMMVEFQNLMVKR